jgi:hypothetical protein
MAISVKNTTDALLTALGLTIDHIDWGTDLFGDPGASSDINPAALDHAGENLTFTATATNTGTIDLTNVVVADGLGNTIGKIADLAAGDSEAFTAAYTTTQADIDQGGTLFVVAKAADDQGDQVTASQGVPVLQLPGLSISETFDTMPYDPRNAGRVDHAYQSINYRVSVTNTGNETLTGLHTTDGHTLDQLPVGQIWIYTTSHQVTQTEMDQDGAPPNPADQKDPAATGIVQTTTVEDDQGDNASATVATPVVQDPQASILLVSADQTSVNRAGQVINFTVIEANTGNVTLTTTVTEGLNGASSTLDTDTLVPGQAKILHYSYAVTQADMDAGLSIRTLAQANAPGAAFGDNSWKQTGVDVDQKPTVNVENLESFDGGQTWYFHQMPGFANAANVQAAFKAATGMTPDVVGYTTAPNVRAGAQVLHAALVTNTGNVTDHQLSVQGFTFDSQDLAPGASMLSHTSLTTASSTPGTYTNSVWVSGNHTNSYGWNIAVPFGLTSNTDTASYSVGNVVGAGTIGAALNLPNQPSFAAAGNAAPTTTDNPWAAADALLAQIRQMQDAQTQTVKAAVAYIDSLPPLPIMSPQNPSPPSGGFTLSDLQLALNQLMGVAMQH